MSGVTLQRLQETTCKTVSHVLTKMFLSVKPYPRQGGALCFSVAQDFSPPLAQRPQQSREAMPPITVAVRAVSGARSAPP